jgi:hypothetical protein
MKKFNEELFGIGKNKGIYADIQEVIFDNPEKILTQDGSKDLPYLQNRVITFSHELNGKALEIEHHIQNINKFKITLDGEPINLKSWDKIQIGNGLKNSASDSGQRQAKNKKAEFVRLRAKEDTRLGVGENFKHLKTFEQFNF